MSNSKRFNYFKGSFVYILTRSLKSTINRNTGNVIIEGFLYDECDECYYLTQAPDSTEVTESIQKNEVVRMFIPVDEMIQMLESQGISDSELN